MPDNKDSSIFKGTVDRYNGVTVNSAQEYCNTEEFSTKLDGEQNYM